MSKSATAFDLALPARAPGTAAIRWMHAALRDAILDGRLRPGARLPATRELAAQHGLARGTVVYVFDQLKAEGYLEGTIGSGTYVSKVLPEQLLQVAGAGGPGPVERAGRRLSAYGRRVRPFSHLEPRASRAFRPNLPALNLFPAALWAQVAARRLRQVTGFQLLGCHPLGYPPLRRAVADYLNSSRGVQCAAEQVVIVSGVQEAIDLTARLCLDPGDRVVMETPGYPGAYNVFEALGARVVPAPLEPEGLRIRGAAMRAARLVYVTPGHQFPAGYTMSLPRRLALLEWARESGAAILEDDYDSEYRYSGRPVPALQGLDRHGSVLFTGSFSKVLFPSLRLGYLVVPDDLVERVAAVLSVTSRHAPVEEQAIVCDFLTEGHFGRHLRRMRGVYAERVGALLDGARHHLAGLLDVCEIEAGLQTAGWLRAGLTGEAAQRAAARHEVEVVPLSEYRCGGPVAEGLQLGFAAVDEKQIRRGVERLARALEEERRSAGAPPPIRGR